MMQQIKPNSAFVFDMDGTLIYSDPKIGIPLVKDGKIIKVLGANEYSSHILGHGEKFDYSFASCPTRFTNFSMMTDIFYDIFYELDQIINRTGSDCVLYILTARQSCLHDAIFNFICNHEIETLKHENIICLEEGFAPIQKKQKLEQIRAKHTGDVIFIDDDEKNIACTKTIPGVISKRVKCQIK